MSKGKKGSIMSGKESLRFQFIAGIFVVCFALAGAEGGMKLQKEEQEAVYSVLSSVYGEWWNWAHEYPDPCDSTPIHGVECSRIGNEWHVTAVFINGLDPRSPPCSCSAAIHPSIFSLRYLHVMVFFNCFSVCAEQPYPFPSHGWRNLSHLTNLNFVNNPGLVGVIPREIGSLSSLQVLEVASAGMEGEIPKEVGKLTKLNRLTICHTRVSGPLPQSIAKLKKLEYLKLNNNGFSGDLSALGHLKSLKRLNLAFNSFEGRIPESFGGLKELLVLRMNHNALGGPLPESLAEMTSLEILLLFGNPLLKCDIMELEWEKLRNLVVMSMWGCQIVGSLQQTMDDLKRRLKAIRLLILDKHTRILKCLPSDFASQNQFCGHHVPICNSHEEL